MITGKVALQILMVQHISLDELGQALASVTFDDAQASEQFVAKVSEHIRHSVNWVEDAIYGPSWEESLLPLATSESETLSGRLVSDCVSTYETSIAKARNLGRAVSKQPEQPVFNPVRFDITTEEPVYRNLRAVAQAKAQRAIFLELAANHEALMLSRRSPKVDSQ